MKINKRSNEINGEYNLWNKVDTKLYEVIALGNIEDVSKHLKYINNKNINHVMFIIITTNNIKLFKYILNNVSDKILNKEKLTHTLIKYNKPIMLKHITG